MEFLYFDVFVFSAINYSFFLIFCMKLRNRRQISLLTVTQVTFTYSKSTIETQKKVWNMFKVNNKNTRMTSEVKWIYFRCYVYSDEGPV